MNVYRLFWELLKHIAHGRGRDGVSVSLIADPDLHTAADRTGTVRRFYWESDADAYCMLEASMDPLYPHFYEDQSDLQPYTPSDDDIKLVNTAWKDATCHHYRDSVCLNCCSAAILRDLHKRYVLASRTPTPTPVEAR